MTLLLTAVPFLQDEYHVAPRDNAHRSSEFIHAKGLAGNSDIKLVTHLMPAIR
jgi:hypothetical protein